MQIFFALFQRVRKEKTGDQGRLEMVVCNRVHALASFEFTWTIPLESVSKLVLMRL